MGKCFVEVVRLANNKHAIMLFNNGRSRTVKTFIAIFLGVRELRIFMCCDEIIGGRRESLKQSQVRDTARMLPCDYYESLRQFFSKRLMKYKRATSELRSESDKRV